MKEMLIDRAEDAPVLAGYRVITSEIEFLQHAPNIDTPLWIRGESLCDWAVTFFEARRIPYRDAVSPSRELRSMCPAISRVQAEALYHRLQSSFHDLARPLGVPTLLAALYPNRLWSDYPSKHHAAQWLLWLIEQQPDDAVSPLLDTMCEQWQRQFDEAESVVYTVRTADAAIDALDQWLGITDGPAAKRLGQFPLTVPAVSRDRARSAWQADLIRTKGAHIALLNQRPLHPAIKLAAAQAAKTYFRANPDDLTEERLAQLSLHLTFQEQTDLRRQCPPSAPAPLPTIASDILEWFDTQYLPYRSWQTTNRVHRATQEVQVLARQFAMWYLEQYPQALMGGELGSHLSFARAGDLLTSDPSITTLLIVLDGLHAADAQHLRLQIANRVPRVLLVSREFVFAPLPTVTVFCKDALFRAVPPARVSDVSPIGEILPESVSPVEHLRSAQPGRVYLWRVLEPDNTYHKRNGYDTLQREVEAQLDSVAAKVADIVAEVPAEVSLRIVITTDHGRLLARSSRNLAVPHGMQTHGRTAWGTTDKNYPPSGYFIEEDVVYLHAERFGLPCEAALVLSEGAFLTSDGKMGAEWYPHGGLYPEEVIIPWFVYARDSERAMIEIRLRGRCQANKRGQIEIQVVNSSDISVTLLALELDLGQAGTRTLSLDWQSEPQTEIADHLDLTPWPSATDAKYASGTVKFRQPNGLVFDVEVSVDLHSEEMYAREDILEGLDL